jgi:peptidoglycan hydrolase-like protein with peptidoglycan-binding domain
MAGAPNLSKGNGQPIDTLSYEQIKELQRMLTARGFDVGEADGKIGAGTRRAVKSMQLKYKLPADSYPTTELYNAMRGNRAADASE